MLCGDQRLYQTRVILGDITDQQYAMNMVRHL